MEHAEDIKYKFQFVSATFLFKMHSFEVNLHPTYDRFAPLREFYQYMIFFPNERYANTTLEANVKFAVFENVFGIMVDIADYDTETHIQTKSNLQGYPDMSTGKIRNLCDHFYISRTKKRYGLAQNEYNGRTGTLNYYVSKHHDHKEVLIIETFKYFGLL